MRAQWNPPHPFHAYELVHDGPPPPAQLEVLEERAKSIITTNDSPDVGFRHGVNAYRGCVHACAYCYARASHTYLGLGAGTDFERRVVVKVNAASLLDHELRRRPLGGEPLVFSGNTDCYQALEGRYRITRACLEVCVAHRQPVAIITKGVLIERDLDVLVELRRVASIDVMVSVAFDSDEDARLVEPSAASPTRRLETIARLTAAGISVGVSISPVIPGLNDSQIVAVLRGARAAGATHAFMTPVRLPKQVREVFEKRLNEDFPHRAAKVLGAIRALRGGMLNEPRFGARMRGSGHRWDAIERMFTLETRRLGYQTRAETTTIERDPSEVASNARRSTGAARASETRAAPHPRRQLTLFDEE